MESRHQGGADLRGFNRFLGSEKHWLPQVLGSSRGGMAIDFFSGSASSWLRATIAVSTRGIGNGFLAFSSAIKWAMAPAPSTWNDRRPRLFMGYHKLRSTARSHKNWADANTPPMLRAHLSVPSMAVVR